MFERYTERARRVIFFARYEASQFGSMTIESEHFLLGLLREDKNLLNRFLRNSTAVESIRKEIEHRTIIHEKVPTAIDLPISDDCKRILAYAAEESGRLNHRHIGTEHLLLGILREEKCVAAEILQLLGFRANLVRDELARAPVRDDSEVGRPPPMGMLFSSLHSPVLPKSGVVPDAETAKRIAEAVWIPVYGAETVANQTPLYAELQFNVWVVKGSTSPESALFAFILQVDGRIVSVGQGQPPAGL